VNRIVLITGVGRLKRRVQVTQRTVRLAARVTDSRQRKICQLYHSTTSVSESNDSLEVIFPDWLDERFPLYALHPSRNYLPPKTRAFLDFVIATVKSPT
jgi:hypothetical protein